ncbi:MAG TPA: methyltransferase domain-containing protein [Candidatus Limnocylindrales bacterium]|nr:methyltransferase domain-containing protein [Candidatus Limnocylindrales bacterium]
MAGSGDAGQGDEPRSVCGGGSGCACAVGNEFGESTARGDLRSYRKSGPPRTTQWLLEGLRAGGVDGLSVLDIGAGVGAVHLALLEAGAESAVDVDGSPAYVTVARDEAARQGLGDRVGYEVGDFVTLAPSIAPADVVVLDRVICCYPDMDALVRQSVARARLRYGLVYPRDRWWIRALAATYNGAAGLARRRVRVHAHRTAEVDAIVRGAGFEPRFRRAGIFWQVVVYERASV